LLLVNSTPSQPVDPAAPATNFEGDHSRRGVAPRDAPSRFLKKSSGEYCLRTGLNAPAARGGTGSPGGAFRSSQARRRATGATAGGSAAVAGGQEGWLLHAYDIARKEVRTFDLFRIRNLHTTEATFEPPAGVDVRKRARHGYGRYTGNEADLCTVRIALDPVAAGHARAKPWHESQQLTERLDGGAEITLQVSHLAGVKRDVLSWGLHVEVLEPAALRAELRSTLQSTLVRYTMS
jgi:hypothetical protein